MCPLPTTNNHWPSENAWTGGQYSVVRVIIALTLAVSAIVQLGTAAASAAEYGGLLVAIALSIALGLGWHDRVVAFLLFVTVVIGLNAGDANALATLVLCAILLLHAALPPAPFGSLDARGRTDPDDRWRFPPYLFDVAWLLLCAAYAYNASRMLYDHDHTAFLWAAVGFQYLFVIALLVPPARAWLWLIGVVLQVMLLFAGDTQTAAALLLLHAITFNPAWLPPLPGTDAVLYFDGDCGLCHRWVRLVLAEDRDGDVINVSPLQGDTIKQHLNEERRKQLPDSIVLIDDTEDVRVKSVAIIKALDLLGGLWRIASWLMRLFPAPLRDFVYDRIAAIRHRIFARPKQACPLMPPELRGRFLP